MKLRFLTIMGIVAALFCSCDGTLSVDEAVELASNEKAEIASGKVFEIETGKMDMKLDNSPWTFTFKDFGSTWRVDLTDNDTKVIVIKKEGQVYMIDGNLNTGVNVPEGESTDMAMAFCFQEASIREEMIVSNLYTESTKEICGKKCVCFTDASDTTTWSAGYKRLVFGSCYKGEASLISSFTEDIDESVFSLEPFTIL